MSNHPCSHPHPCPRPRPRLHPRPHPRPRPHSHARAGTSLFFGWGAIKGSVCGRARLGAEFWSADEVGIELGHALLAGNLLTEQKIIPAAIAGGGLVFPPQRADRWTALHHAAEHGSVLILAAVIAAAKEERETLPKFDSPSPLHVAVANGHPAAAAALLREYGLSADQQDAWGRSASELACMQRWPRDLLQSTFGAGSVFSLLLPLPLRLPLPQTRTVGASLLSRVRATARPKMSDASHHASPPQTGKALHGRKDGSDSGRCAVHLRRSGGWVAGPGG